MIQVYIGIGSNLDHPIEQVQRAIANLQHIPNTRYLKSSALYRSEPMGPSDQPDYINAVSLLETDLLPLALLDVLQSIEASQGRVRKERWGPRTLDLDILLYGEKTIKDDRLTVPHPGLHERSFVLYPLQEINPELVIPGFGSIESLLEKCNPTGLERLEHT